MQCLGPVPFLLLEELEAIGTLFFEHFLQTGQDTLSFVCQRVRHFRFSSFCLFLFFGHSFWRKSGLSYTHFLFDLSHVLLSNEIVMIVGLHSIENFTYFNFT